MSKDAEAATLESKKSKSKDKKVSDVEPLATSTPDDIGRFFADRTGSSGLTRSVEGDTRKEQERAEKKRRKKERKLLEAAQARADGDGMDIDPQSQGENLIKWSLGFLTKDVFLVVDEHKLDTKKRKKNRMDAEKTEQGIDEDTRILGELGLCSSIKT